VLKKACGSLCIICSGLGLLLIYLRMNFQFRKLHVLKSRLSVIQTVKYVQE